MKGKETRYAKLYMVSDVLVSLFLVNIYWTICNVPIIFLVLSFFFAKEPNPVILFPLFIFFLPILFFPSFQALVCSMRDIVLNRPSTGSVKRFFFYVKENYLESVGMGVFITVAGSFLIRLLMMVGLKNVLLSTILFIILLYIVMFALQFFPLAAHFSMSFVWKLKQTWRLTFAKPIYAISSLLLTVLLVWISWKVFPPLLVLLTASAAAYLLFFLFYFEYNQLKNK